MSKMSQQAAAVDENIGLADLEEAKAETKDAYEFLEKLEATTWCKATQGKIQAYLRSVDYWPAKTDAETPAEL